jgi:subtilase family serine protease
VAAVVRFAAVILCLQAICFGPSALDAAAPVCVPAVAMAGTVTLSASSAPPYTAFTSSQLQTAYGISSISLGSTTGNGAGQTIAIIDAYNDPNIISDTKAFSSTMGLGQFNVSGGPTLTVLNETGGTSLPTNATPGTTSASVEESLDVEWAHSVAPKANIILFEAASLSWGDLLTAVQTAAGTKGVSVVSMSWGGSEFSGENTLDSYFTTPSGHPNVAFVAATGDSGAPGSYPAFSPNVVAVGGTSLTLSPSRNETAWNYTVVHVTGGTVAEGGGGGASTQETEPSYQKAAKISDPSGMRETPDVSFDADPNTGVAVYDSYDFGSGTPWAQYGGTSLAAPCVAALLSIADQFRTAEKFPLLDGPADLYSVPTSDYNDITSGNIGPNGTYPAGPGYDMATGIGSPIANLLVPALGEIDDGGVLVPEPGTLALLAAAGLAGTVICRRRR